jgi:ABC-type branched-chain amino acid transport system, permease component
MAEFWLYVLVISGIYTIFSLALLLQFGVAGLPNFGNGAFMAVSAYAMAIIVVKLGAPMVIAAPVAIVAAVLFGLLLAVPTIRLRADYLAIATIAAGEIVRYLALNLQDFTGGAAGTVNILGPGVAADYNAEWRHFQGSIQDGIATLLGQRVPTDLVMAIIVWPLALLLCAAVWYMVRSPWGRALRSIREDEDASTALGKNVFRYRLQAFSVGAALAGLAGLLLAWEVSSFNPDDFRSSLTFYAFVIVILGGKSRVWAVPVGAIIFSTVFAATRFLDFWPLSLISSGDRAFLRLMVVGVALIVLVLWRPQGIFGSKAEVALEQ